MSFNPDRVNIHELTIEDPEQQSELPFDPERDITPKDWEVMESAISRAENWHDFSAIAMRMKILDPQVKHEFYREERQRTGMEKELEYLRTNNNGGSWISFSAHAMAMKILNPEANADLNDTDWKNMKDQLAEWKGIGSWDYFGPMAMRMKILNPKIDLGLDRSAWQGMKDELHSRKAKDHIGVFSSLAMSMKILDPNQDLEIDQTDWQNMKDKLDKLSKGQGTVIEGFSKDFSSLAMAMTILAAEEVKVPLCGGLEVIARKDKPFKDGTPPMPEIKQF